MKTLVNIETGKLNEFLNFYPCMNFQSQASKEVYELIEKELSEEIKNSPEFWCSEFSINNETFVIAADGEINSSGRYVVAKITEE